MSRLGRFLHLLQRISLSCCTLVLAVLSVPSARAVAPSDAVTFAAGRVSGSTPNVRRLASERQRSGIGRDSVARQSVRSTSDANGMGLADLAATKILCHRSFYDVHDGVAHAELRIARVRWALPPPRGPPSRDV